jgi:superfamily II DNA or RNA helicase
VQTTLHVSVVDGVPAAWAAIEPVSSPAADAYGLDAKALGALFATLPIDGFQAPLATSSANAWLPTRRGVVAPPADAGGSAATGARVVFQRRTVCIASLTWPQTVALLSESLGRETFGDGIRIGRDLAALGRVLRLAFELIAGKHVLPGLVLDAPKLVPRARWQPVLGAPERAICAAIAAVLPPVAGALSTADSTTAPCFDARATLDAALAFFVDSAMRSVRPAPARAPGTNASIHARWLAALAGLESAFRAAPDECAELARAIEAWRRPVLEERAAAYRLCLRVEEPVPEAATAEGANWNVAYLLQSRADPSLLVDGTEAMRSAALRREYLTALGRAAPFSDKIDASLGQPGGGTPDGFRLDTAGAFTFLQTDAASCAAAGIGVILPSWWLGMDAKARIGLRAVVKRPKFAGANDLHAGALLEIDWTIALGNDALTSRELARLARLKTPLVQLRGRWVHVDPGELQAALARVKRAGSRTLTVRDAVRLAVGAPVDGIPSGTTLVAAGKFADQLARLRGHTHLEPIAPPATLNAVLRPYQTRGYSWLHFVTHAGFGACLADDMGLGKTVQTLALIARDWENAPDEGPVLLVCPTSVIGNWQREAARFAPALPVHVHHGTDRTRGTAFEKMARGQAVVVTGYALLHRDRALFERVGWRGIVLDEAQNIKNADSQQARAARSIDAGYRVALTGTPVENHVGDLWSLMEFLNPGMLGSHAGFRRSFFVPIQLQGDTGAAERLRALTGPFVLRRHKSDATIIADLPAKQEYTVTCTLTREQATLYAAVLRDFDATLAQDESIERRGKILGALSKLKQICNHPAQFAADNSPLAGRSGKLARLEEMLEEVFDAGEAALIFTQFAEMGHLLRRRLEARFGREVAFLHGGVAKKTRDTIVERFGERRGADAFILSLKAGGSGLNLTRANHVFHFDRWWNPAVENQATDRAFRIGQTKNVQVHKFVCGGTLEEKIAVLIERKAAISEQVIGSGEGWLTELSSSQLRDLVALAPEAVAE